MGCRERFRESPGFFGWVGSGGVPIYTIPIFRGLGFREHRQNGQKPVFDFGFWANFQLFGTSGSYGGFLRADTGLAFWLGILIPPLLPKRSVFGILIRPPVPEERGVKVNFFGSKKKKIFFWSDNFFHKTKVIRNLNIRKLTA